MIDYKETNVEVLKVLKVLINNSNKAIELFQREAQVLSQLNHPGIPQVEPGGYFTFKLVHGQLLHCLVMEKIKGMNLREYIEKSKQPIDSFFSNSLAKRTS